MPAPVAVLVEVDGEPVFQAYIAYCAICRGPCRGAPPPKVAYAKPRKKKTGSQNCAAPQAAGWTETQPAAGNGAYASSLDTPPVGAPGAWGRFLYSF